jgi:hypothetical protein
MTEDIQVVEFPTKTEYTRRGRFHRIDGPAIEWKNGSEEYYLSGKRHREDDYAVLMKDDAGNVRYTQWWRFGKLHRTDGPAIILADGSEEWYLDGIRHRVGGPAFTRRDSSGEIIVEQWFTDGRLNRIDGPAVTRIIEESINKDWLYNRIGESEPGDGEGEENGEEEPPPPPPPIPSERRIVVEEWWVEGQKHRLEGPAVIFTNYEPRVIREEWWSDNQKNRFEIDGLNNWLDLIIPNQSPIRITVPVGRYDTFTRLLNGIRNGLNAAASPNVFQYSLNVQTLIVTWTYTGLDELSFRFSSEEFVSLGSILGFNLEGGVVFPFVGNTLSGTSAINFPPRPSLKIYEGIDTNDKPIFTEEYWINNQLSRADGPSVIQFVITTPDANRRFERVFDYCWYTEGKLNRVGAPAKEFASGTTEWWSMGVRTRLDGPALVEFIGRTEDDQPLFNNYWYVNGLLTRDNDLPAIERADGTLEWFINDRRERVGFPALIRADGSEFWYRNGVITRLDGPAAKEFAGNDELGNPLYDFSWYVEGLLSRDGAPAVEEANGSKFWYTEGKLNRPGGFPAVELSNGDREWWVLGVLSRDDGPAIQRADGTEVWATNIPLRTDILITEPPIFSVDENFIRGLFGNQVDKIVSITQTNREFYVEMQLLERPVITDLISSISKQVLVGRRLDVNTIVILQPPEFGYTINFIQSVFSKYASRISSITLVGREYFVTFTAAAAGQPSIEAIYKDFISNLVSQITFKVEPVQGNQGFREEDPALITPEGSFWYRFGKIDRLGLPAAIYNNGDQLWFSKGELNREDGPAVERANGDREWWILGVRTREGFPAIEFANGGEEWWFQGVLTRGDDLPARKVFVGYTETQNLWIKFEPVGGFKRVVKQGVTGNGGNFNPLIWETTFVEPGIYYYVSQNIPENHGEIELLEGGVEDPTPQTLSVTLNEDNRFQINGEETPKITLTQGDTLTLNLNLGRPSYDYYWFTNGVLTRGGDQPAIVRADGTLEWFTNGLRNRSTGPAVIRPDGSVEYWLLGVRVTEGDLP